MYAFMSKYGQALAFGLGVLITIIFLGSAIGSDTIETIGPSVEDTEKYNSTLFNFGIGAAIFLAGLAAAAMLIFGVGQIVSNPKGSLKGIIGLALVAVLMFIGYSTSSGVADHPTIETAINKFQDAQSAELTAGNLKFIGGAIVTALVLMAASFVVLIVFGVRNLFK
ncbi:MAG: hypothetical protein AAFQ37_02395 [Bacteroidota bacterium]